MDVQDIPLRLTPLERIYLSVIRSALNTSQYTSKVDIRTHRKSYIIQDQLEEFISICIGLLYSSVSGTNASSALKGVKKELQTCLKNKRRDDFLPILADMVEVARRYKIMNPHKMRGEYGKLVHLLMDAKIYRLYKFGEKPIQTLGNYLEEYDLTGILEDETILSITSVRHSSKDKSYAAFVEKHAKDESQKQVVERALHSLADAQSYIHQCVTPIERMLVQLKKNFQQDENGLSLTIRAGRQESKLSHDHITQYKFVYQSLLLWKNIMVKMYTLSIASEKDLFSSDASRYSLVDTGQGLNRIQSAHNVGRHMQRILSSVKSEAGRWVGLSVVHLGDRDVPNALVFIDKYRQVPSIINPIILTIERIPKLCEEDEGVDKYIQSTFGSVEKVQLEILRDFFRHGFNGSGGDGGSCIDGRTTSAWHWCSRISKKKYYPVFLLGGFQSFDGDWN